jgi:ribonuclease HII
MDEAGLGPNLGPLVVAATVWQTPAEPRGFDFWQAFQAAVSDNPADSPHRLLVADSKLAYQPGRGLTALERTVLAAWSWGAAVPAAQEELKTNGPHRRLTVSEAATPWESQTAVSLPCAGAADDIERAARCWKSCAEGAGAPLVALIARVVQPSEFNRWLCAYENKSHAVAVAHREVARMALAIAAGRETLLVSDKQGGRNRYAGYLSEVVEGGWIDALEESAEMSAYRCGRTEFRFQPRGERFLPVALASMVAKYLRELSMLSFNAYWEQQRPGIRPTQGYPVDARRFYGEIAPLLPGLGIDESAVWRAK